MPAPVPAETCPACGRAGRVTVRTVPDHEYGLAHRVRYATCADCESEYQTPMPTLGELADFYPSDYHSMQGGGFLQRLRDTLRLRRLRRLLDGEGALLDYGCGDGRFLVHAAARMRGRQLFGYEIGPRPEIRRLAGDAVTLVRGDLATLLDVLPPCRLVTMNHVIEHLPDPLAVISALAARLVPGGILDGQTPAVGSLEQLLFGTRWSGYHAPRHTLVFARDGLRRLLARAGLSDVSITGAFNPAGLALSLASLAHGDAPGVIRRRGPRWLAHLGVATLLAPFDLLSGAPAVIDFRARKAA